VKHWLNLIVLAYNSSNKLTIIHYSFVRLALKTVNTLYLSTLWNS